MIRPVAILLALILAVGCTPPQFAQKKPRAAFRQLPPPPVYSRVMWAHPPQPIGKKASNSSPLIQPVISFELPESTLREAIEALAQSIGYNWHYPAGLARRSVSIKMVGSVEEILLEIGRQGGVGTELDHQRRLVRVVGRQMQPRLPGY